MHDFAVYYIETNILCVIVFVILLLHNHFNIDRQEKQIKFDHVLLAFIFYFLVDCFWAAIVDGLIPKRGVVMITILFLIYLLRGFRFKIYNTIKRIIIVLWII